MTKNQIEKRLSRLHWFVYRFDFNTKEIKPYDVFNHYTFLEDLKVFMRSYSKTIPDFKAFNERLTLITKSCYWSRCEYEILLTGWPPHEGRPEETKIDIYDQLNLNWQHFAEYTFTGMFGDDDGSSEQ